MKKIIFAFFAACLASNISAYDEIFVKPMTIALGDDADQTLEVMINNTSNDVDVDPARGITAVSLDITLPSEFGIEEKDWAITERGMMYNKRGKLTDNFSKNGSRVMPNGDVRFIFSASQGAGLLGTSGTVLKILFWLEDVDAPAGYYPVIVKGEYSDTESHVTKIPESVSYIKIGNPTGNAASFAPEGLLPSTVAEALENETLNTLDLSKCRVNGALPFVNGCNYTFPTEGLTLAGVSHARTIGEGNFASVVFPVDMPVNDKCYVFTGMDGGVAKFAHPTGNVLPAGTTGLVIGDVTYLNEAEVTITAANAGVAKRREDVSEGWYVNDNKLKKCNHTNFAPFRGAFPIPEDANVRGFMLDTADGIITLDADLNVESIYDLQGRKLQNARRGVNIINGQKRLVK